jgi:hypothetical protein
MYKGAKKRLEENLIGYIYLKKAPIMTAKPLVFHQAPNPLSAFKFKYLTHKKTVLLVP